MFTIEALLPMIKAILPNADTMTLEEKSAMVHNVERILASWFAQKKQSIGLRADENSVVLLFDLDATGTLRMCPVSVFDGQSALLGLSLAHLDVAMRNHAAHVGSTDAARGDEIRKCHDLIASILKLAQADQLVNRFLPEHGINVTNMSQCIPAFDFLDPFLSMMPKGEKDVMTEERMQAIADMFIGILRQAANLPSSRLVQRDVAYDPRLAEQTAAPALQAIPQVVQQPEALSETPVSGQSLPNDPENDVETDIVATNAPSVGHTEHP